MKSYNWDRFTSDNVVSNAPCLVGTVLVTGDGVDTADITLYDGESAQDPQLCKIKAGKTNTRVVRFQPPLLSNRGLYLAFGSNVEEVLIEYEREKE